jgi:hypothetical protein
VFEFGAGQGKAAQIDLHRVGQRGQQQAQLVGLEPVAAGTPSKQVRLDLLDTVFGLATGIGKAERFTQWALRGWAYGFVYNNSAERLAMLREWNNRYNWHRPHRGIAAKRQCPGFQAATTTSCNFIPRDGRIRRAR